MTMQSEEVGERSATGVAPLLSLRNIINILQRYSRHPG